MKKLLLTGLAVVTFGGLLNAQVSPVNQLTGEKFQAADAPTGKATVNHFGKTDISDWYFTQEFTQNSNSPINDGLKRYVGFLAHDSLAKFSLKNSGGTFDRGYGVNFISAGAVLDPKDDAIDMTNNPGIKLDKYVSYKLDSININYLYVRNVDSLDDGQGGKVQVVDTVFVAYFRGNQISKLNFTASGNKLATVGWTNGNVRMPANYIKMDTFLIFNGGDPRNIDFDTTQVNTSSTGVPEGGWRSKFTTLKAPDNVTIDANNGNNNDNLVAFTFTFKSGVPTVLNGDTAWMIYQEDPNTFPVGGRRTNYFGFGYNQNEGAVRWSNPTYFNTTLLALKSTSYVQPTQDDWNGYVSGNAFTQENFIYADFKLTTTSNNVGINDIKNDRFALSNVYPNPASSNGSAVLGFSLKNNADVKITIVNLVGQEVKTIVSSKYVAGQHEVVFNLDGMQTGVYFVNMVVDGASQTKKLTITQ